MPFFNLRSNKKELIQCLFSTFQVSINLFQPQIIRLRDWLVASLADIFTFLPLFFYSKTHINTASNLGMVIRTYKKLKIVLSGHALERLTGRFQTRDPAQIKRIVEQAALRGLCSIKGKDVLIEYGCLLIIGVLNDGVLTVTTVLNLSNRISKKHRERLCQTSQPPWGVATIELPQLYGGFTA